MLSLFDRFLKLEAAGGILLVLAAIVALFWANSPYADSYVAILDVPVAVSFGTAGLAKPLLLWVNDGLMALFFLVVGLEIKREALHGSLSSLSKASLPAIAALGGMAVPALVYCLFSLGNPATLSGWAIPAATDIAFALGVLALAGRSIPLSLKTFLLALAVIDDLGAIIIIALFYTADLSVISLALAGVAIVALFTLNRLGVTRLTPYLLIGAFLWVCVLKSGVHATLAGVILAFALPMRSANGAHSPADHVEHTLHPWSTYAILPFFAFVNAGVNLDGIDWSALANPVTLGIAFGLFVGKQSGVMLFSLAACRLKLARLPDGASLMQFYGVAILTGIGFTMSLFIGTLAFTTHGYEAPVRLGVLGGSLLSAVIGFTVLKVATARAKPVSGS
ncbi:Na+/H+ antiporter NhaA [Insolitispirillum peregrinum]|uniref:Na+/H+ antiporter NhaA n=1 Tax=Insolitispirillum peregrinum TaxID=80876 RepID=UPI00361BA0EC